MSQGEKREITLTRIFDALRELVYRAFVDPDQPNDTRKGWEDSFTRLDSLLRRSL